jgi:hypothetical protein
MAETADLDSSAVWQRARVGMVDRDRDRDGAGRADETAPHDVRCAAPVVDDQILRFAVLVDTRVFVTASWSATRRGQRLGCGPRPWWRSIA